jgi:hypothetical protein
MEKVEVKMQELENEYTKRLNYYKGYSQNYRFVDTAYDRVFGKLEDNKNDREYDGVYSGTDSAEADIPLNIYVRQAENHRGANYSPLRRKYVGFEHEMEQAYNDRKIKFANNMNNRSFSSNNRSNAFDMYKSKTNKR